MWRSAFSSGLVFFSSSTAVYASSCYLLIVHYCCMIGRCLFSFPLFVQAVILAGEFVYHVSYLYHPSPFHGMHLYVTVTRIANFASRSQESRPSSACTPDRGYALALASLKAPRLLTTVHDVEKLGAGFRSIAPVSLDPKCVS